MLRDLLKEGGLYALSSLVTRGISLLLIPFYTAYFSPEDYGIIDILVVFGTVFTTIFSFQLNQGLGRYVADSKTEVREKAKIASTTIIFFVVAHVIAGGLILLFPGPFINLISNEELTIPFDSFALALTAISVNGIFYLLGVYLRFLRKSKAYAIYSFLFAVLSIVLTIYLVLYMDMGINGIYIAGIISAPPIIIGQLISLRDHLTISFVPAYLKKLLRFSTPLVPASLAYVALNFVDRIFIKEYLSFGEEGIYGIGMKFASIVSIIVMGFSSALAPILYQNHHDDNYRIQLGRILRLFFVVGTIGVLILSSFSKEMLMIFTNENYYAAAHVMPVLYISVLLTGLGMFAPGLHLKERTKIIPVIVLIASLVNVILNYILISQFHLIGAAIATAISMALNNFSQFYFSQAVYRIPIEQMKMFLFSMVFMVLWWFGSYSISQIELSPDFIVLLKATLIIIYAALLVAGKMVNLKSLKNLNEKIKARNR